MITILPVEIIITACNAFLPNGSSGYSSSVMVITGGTHNWIVSLCLLEMYSLYNTKAQKITGLINIQIQKYTGYILNGLHCASNSTIIQIPENNLGKGIS